MPWDVCRTADTVGTPGTIRAMTTRSVLPNLLSALWVHWPWHPHPAPFSTSILETYRAIFVSDIIFWIFFLTLFASIFSVFKGMICFRWFMPFDICHGRSLRSKNTPICHMRRATKRLNFIGWTYVHRRLTRPTYFRSRIGLDLRRSGSGRLAAPVGHCPVKSDSPSFNHIFKM